MVMKFQMHKYGVIGELIKPPPPQGGDCEFEPR